MQKLRANSEKDLDAVEEKLDDLGHEAVKSKSQRIRTTVYIDAPKLRVLKQYGFVTGVSVSELINDALVEYSDELVSGLIAFERMEHDRGFLTHEELMEELKKDGAISD